MDDVAKPLGVLTWEKALEAATASTSNALEEEELVSEAGGGPGRGLATNPRRQTDVEDRVYSLDLHNRGVTALEEGSLSRLRRLRSLDLSFNEIVKIAGIDRVSTLRELKLYNNKIKDLTPLCTPHGRSALERLYLHGNKITSLPPSGMLKSLRALRELRLDGNKLTSLENIGALQALTTLNCCNNKLTAESVRELSQLRRLHTLDLSGNDIRNVHEGGGIATLGER